MAGKTLSAREAARILFPPGTDPAEAASASFRSGADVCELLAEHFGFAPADYARLLAEAPTAERGTVYACPTCGGTSFDEWDLHDVRFRGVTVLADESGTPDLTHNDYSGGWESGESYDLDTLTCLGCHRVDLELEDLVPVAVEASVTP